MNHPPKKQPAAAKPPTNSPAASAAKPATDSAWMKALRGSGDWIVPIAAVCMVFVMLVPLPGFVLDLLLTISASPPPSLCCSPRSRFSRPVQFSVFPSLLLLLTLHATFTRSCEYATHPAARQSDGPAAAGHVIEAFGQFVVGGNYIVGFRPVPRVDRDPVPGGEPRRGAHRGGHGAVHASMRCRASRWRSTRT